jgi:hypothetical protein
MVKWQEIAKLLTSGIGIIALISSLILLTGMEYEHSGDIYCGETCESYINITTSYWRVCFEDSDKEEVLYKKRSRSRTLWVNLNNVDNIISTNPDVEVDWLVPTYGKKWRPIKSGDCWDRKKVNKIKLVGHKEQSQTVKWSFDVGEKINIDPVWNRPDTSYSFLESTREPLQTSDYYESVTKVQVEEYQGEEFSMVTGDNESVYETYYYWYYEDDEKFIKTPVNTRCEWNGGDTRNCRHPEI